MEAKPTVDWQTAPYICRCCLSVGCYKDIWTEYFWMGKKEIYSEMLLDIFNVTISEQDSHSRGRLICEVCVTRLRDAASFKYQVLENEGKFLEHVHEIQQQDLPEPPSEVKTELMNEEMIELNDVKEVDDDFSSMDDETLGSLKVEKYLKMLRPTSKSVATQQKRQKRQAKKKITVEVPSGSKKTRKGNHKGSVREYDPMREMLNRDASKLIENSNMLAFRWRNNKFMCYCCKSTHLEMSALRAHSETHAKRETSEQIHNRYYPALPKVDITALECGTCGTRADNLADMKTHLNSHGVVFESDKDPLLPYRLGENDFSCTVCGEPFRVFKTLNNHMNKHYGSHICFTCGAGFQHEFALKSHESRHGSKIYTCQKCDLVFQNSYKKMQHYYTVHKKGGRYGCPHCDLKFMDYDKRLAHMVKMHDMVKPSVKCENCEKSFANNKLLRQHVKCSHMNERRYSCKVCNYNFFSSSELRKHSESHKTHNLIIP